MKILSIIRKVYIYSLILGLAYAIGAGLSEKLLDYYRHSPGFTTSRDYLWTEMMPWTFLVVGVVVCWMMESHDR
jgi:hypothetical protein